MLVPFPSCITELGLLARYPELRRLHREHGGITTPCEQSVLEACGELALLIHDFELSSEDHADVGAWLGRLESSLGLTPQNSVNGKDNVARSRRHNPFFRSALYESSPLDFSAHWESTPKKDKSKNSSSTAAEDKIDTESEVGRAITASVRIDPEAAAQVPIPEYSGRSVRFSNDVLVGTAPDVNREPYEPTESHDRRPSVSSTGSLRLPSVPLRKSSRGALRNFASTNNLRAPGEPGSSTSLFAAFKNRAAAIGSFFPSASNPSSNGANNSTVSLHASNGDVDGAATSTLSSDNTNGSDSTNLSGNTNSTANIHFTGNTNSANSINSARSIDSSVNINSAGSTNSSGNTSSSGSTGLTVNINAANSLLTSGGSIPSSANPLSTARSQSSTHTVTPLSYNDYGPGPLQWRSTSATTSVNSEYSQNSTSSGSTVKALRILGVTPAEVGDALGPSPAALHETVTPAHDPALPVHDPALPVHDPALPVHDPALLVHDPAPPVHGPAPPVHDPASPVHDSAPPVHDPATPVRDPVTSVRDPATSLTEFPTPIRDANPEVLELAGALTNVMVQYQYNLRTDIAACMAETTRLLQNFKEEVILAVVDEFAKERAHKLALCRLTGKMEPVPEKLFDSIMEAMTPPRKNKIATLAVPKGNKAEAEGAYPSPLTAIPASAILNTNVPRRRSPLPPTPPVPTKALPAPPASESRESRESRITDSPARGERISRYVNQAIERAKARNVQRHEQGRPLVEVGVPNCVAPKEWPRITSLDTINNMSDQDVANWFEFYTGRQAVGDILGQRIAVANAVGLDVKPVCFPIDEVLSR